MQVLIVQKASLEKKELLHKKLHPWILDELKQIATEECSIFPTTNLAYHKNRQRQPPRPRPTADSHFNTQVLGLSWCNTM